MRPPRNLPPRFKPSSAKSFTGRIKVVAYSSTKKSLLFTKSIKETIYAEMEQTGTLYDTYGTHENRIVTSWEEIGDEFFIKHIDGYVFEVVTD